MAQPFSPQAWRWFLERTATRDVPFASYLETMGLRAHPPVLVRATEEDVDALANLHRAAFPAEGEHWGDGSFRELLREPTVFAIKAVHLMHGNGAELAPRGFVLVREVAGDAEILTIGIHPACQGRGIGRLLLEEVLRELYARRAVSLFLEVAADNSAAIRLYRRLGFEEVGRREGYYARSRDEEAVAALTMRLDL